MSTTAPLASMVGGEQDGLFNLPLFTSRRSPAPHLDLRQITLFLRRVVPNDFSDRTFAGTGMAPLILFPFS
jgi:hypothetical protein